MIAAAPSKLPPLTEEHPVSRLALLAVLLAPLPAFAEPLPAVPASMRMRGRTGSF
jgi:hypothetical protein